MKRFLIGLLVGGVLFTVAFGAAAALNVSGGTIQGGQDITLACQSSNDVNVAYKICASATGKSPEGEIARIFGLELSGFDAACNGNVVLAYLTDNTGNWLGAGNPSMWKASSPIASGEVVVDTYYEGGTWYLANCGEGPLVSLVEQVHIIVKNAFTSGE